MKPNNTYMDDRLLTLLRLKIDKLLPSLVELRHTLHSEPELGLQTKETAAKVREKLADTSIRLHDPLIGNDVVGELDLGHARTLCLRADMDCNPIGETTGLAYSSRKPGLMHACGHDGHTTILVGTALVLDSLKEYLPVNVRFVFQPGEELACGGKMLMENGACDGCDTVYALHGWPGLPLGSVSAREGAMFAAGIQFALDIEGKGCHGAMPEQGRNPIPAASSVVNELYDLHKKLNLQNGSVISVCSVQSGSSANVIPDCAKIQGTARFLSPEIGNEIAEEIKRIACKAQNDWGVSASVTFDRSYDLPTINSPCGFASVRDAALACLPEGRWLDLARPSMGVEDFAFYLKDRGGALFFIGLGENHAALHTPGFDFADEALTIGILMFSFLALTHK